MIKLFLALAALTISDPAAGPVGAAELTPPTDANYRSLAPFDLTDVSLLEGEQIEVALRMASWSNPFELDNGFSHPVIELYIGGGDYGSPDLLPGSGMRLSDGEEWTVALRLTGDRAWGYEMTATGLREFEPVLEMVDDWLYVSTDVAAPESPRLAALTGLYSPFHETGWRPLADEASPWAFSSQTLVLPVVDVLALTEDAQLAALSTGVLPVTQVSTIPRSNTLWLVLMAAGITLAGAGLLWRNAAGRRKVQDAVVDAPVGEIEEHPAADADSEPARDASALAASLVSADRQAIQEPEAESSPPENAVKVGYFRGASQEEVESARERLAQESTAAETPEAEDEPEPEQEPEAEVPPAPEENGEQSSAAHDLDQVIDELRASILAAPEEDDPESPEQEEEEKDSGS